MKSALIETIALPLQASQTTKIGSLSRTDLRNLSLVLFGFLVVVLLIPPVRSFPITDDWAYAQSVSQLLGGTYSPHDYVQPTALGHLMWGALFSLVLGQSFTTLAIANLFMSATCLTTLYLLFRQVGLGPNMALLGTALLGLNPIYVYLSYSFMTEITFTTFMLGSCLCYIRGMQWYQHNQGSDREALLWLLVGSIMASLAYLTRQFGLLLLPAAVGYMWWSGRLTWRRAAAAAAIPLAVFLGYTLFERTLPPRMVDLLVSGALESGLRDPLEYLTRRLQLDTWVAPALGLSLLPLIRLPRRPLYAVPLLALIVFFQVKSLTSYGSVFPRSGNIVDHTGFVMQFYEAARIWSEELWVLLGVFGALIVSLHVVASAELAYKWLRARPWRQRIEDPALLLYAMALLQIAATFIASSFLFDRYLLPILPLLMVPELRRLAKREAGQGRDWRPALVLPIALFSIIGQRDYMEHATVRWRAAEQIATLGVSPEQIDAGMEWAAWHSYATAADYIREKQDLTHAIFPPDAILDPAFAVSDLRLQGYTEIDSLPYVSWLNGGQARRVLLQKRN